MPPVGVDRRAERAHEDVETEAREAEQRAERGADEDDGERLPRDRHGREREVDGDLRGEGDEAGASEDEQHVGQGARPRGKTASRRVAASGLIAARL